ncbi:translocation/assembly module TamB domain-containing protein [Geochorda subterranea]|uniref:Translocation/assembly module TamB domain-containing protein n=1 Tax=Geochorda subterranea TaxID=3109564 RepID=A0ABZ1BPV2_9FIRM|nr:translocation/assembly module TamB domain-containing protein [Limnochorda sp. LNt]WRP14846.1 translocation/assembly module TamB domain-containing protein [Limnochorda sp. LNt]
MSHQEPIRHPPRPRARWLLPAALVLAGALGVAAWSSLADLDATLSAAVRQALSGVGRDAGLTIQVGEAALALPSAVRIAPVQLELRDGGQVYAPGVTVGVDVPAAIAHPRRPARSVRRVEASGVVVRPAQVGPDQEPSPGEPPSDETPPGLAARVARIRQLLVDGLHQLPMAVAWLEVGDSLSWGLDGVWEEPGPAPGEWVRTPWRSAGELQALGPGRVQAEGTVELGSVRADFLAVVSGAGVELRRLTIAQEGLVATASGSTRLADDETLQVALSGRLEWTSLAGGSGRLQVDWRTDGAWDAEGLPPVEVDARVGPASVDGGPWGAMLAGLRLEGQVRQDADGLRLIGGSLRKREARGAVIGHVADAWPHAVVLDFEVAGLQPGEDLPWWSGYAVSSVAARGRLTGSLTGPWRVDGDLQTPAGRLLGLAVGGATAHVVADVTAGQATVDEIVAAAGSGILTLGGQLRWGASAPAVAGEPSRVWLALTGKLEGVASTEVLTALQSLRGSEGAPSGRMVGPAGPRGEVAGDLAMELAWVAPGRRAGSGSRAPVLARVSFDGPDGSIEVVREQGGGYRIAGDLINLGGRALRPWLRTWRGYAAFTGSLVDGTLAGQVRADRLGLAGYELGTLQATVRFEDGSWHVEEASLQGGDVEGTMALRLAADLQTGQASLRLRQRPESGVSAAVEGSLRLASPSLVLEDILVSVQDREVARIGGSVPLTVLGADEAATMDVRARMERFPLELVRQLLPAWQVEGGRLTGDLLVSGTLQAPDVSGGLTVQADRVVAPQERLNPLTDIVVDLRVEGRTIRLAQGQARSARGGDVQLTGEAQLQAIWPLRLDPVDVRVEVRQASVDVRPSGSLQLAGTFTGQLRWAGAWTSDSRPVLSGRLGVRDGRVTVWGFGLGSGTSGPPLDGPGAVRLPETLERAEGRPAAAGGIPLDVTVEAEQPLRLEVPAIGGTALAEGAVRLTGTTDSPALAGEVLLAQARIRYFGREFAIERGRLTFSPSRGLVPEVDLDATTSTPEGPVRVHVEGTTTDPTQLRLSSQPEMSREEILALLLPGAGPAEADARQRWIAGVNEQLAAWAMGPLEEAVRTALGLDEVALVPGTESGSLRLLAGKYLDPGRLYVRYRRELLDPEGSQSFELSYRLKPDLTWRLSWGDEDGEGAFRVGLDWQHSF